ncbi:uncharacterized protein LOC135214577 [Macrobrachium nipponense]|uniref:uncharacterized protein LOC135214577 n=1 Tax=Macrobrachium nipponense TaxID=159736 RepID=UPI0030C7E456
MDSNNRQARHVLGTLSATVTREVNWNKELLTLFLNELQEAFGVPIPKPYRFHIIHAGSSYENLAVDAKADFDVTLSLGQDYVSENFEIERGHGGYFTLEVKRGRPRMHVSGINNMLISKNLRGGVFRAIERYVDLVSIRGTNITSEPQLSAVKVTLKESIEPRRTIYIDLVPQIPVSTWDQCPDLLPLEKMPPSLRQYIDNTNRNRSPCMFFSLGIPKNIPQERFLFNISFSLLEKHFVCGETDIRDMVRLVKYIAKIRDWKDQHHFKSFYAKRVALKYYRELKGKEPWDGYLLLLEKLEYEVNNRVIDGYFVKNQPLREWDGLETRNFIQEIKTVRGMTINESFKEIE